MTRNFFSARKPLQTTYKPVVVAKKGSKEIKASKQSGFEWRTPCSMVLLFCLGVASAIGHHMYYKSLDGQPVKNESDQQSKIRYGSAFAFLTKTTLSSAILIGYDQRTWATFKKKFIKIETVDAILAAPHNLLSFLSLEMIAKVKIGTVLALFVWLLPLTALVTPATLTVKPLIQLGVATIYTPNVDFRDTNLYFTQTTVRQDLDDETSFNLIRHASKVAIAEVIQSPNYNTSLHGSWNVSFTMQLYGPSVKCGPASEKVLGIFAGTSNSQFTDAINQFYYAFTPVVVNDTLQEIDFSISLYLNQDPEFNAQTWIHLNSQNYVCQLYNTSYTATITSEQGVQTTILKDFQDINPVVYTGKERDERQSYAAFMSAFTKIIVGYIKENVQGGVPEAVSTQILNTALINSRDLRLGVTEAYDLSTTASNETFFELMEELSRNITLSLLGSTHFRSDSTLRQVQFTAPVTVYSYDWRNLVISYGVATMVSLIGVGFGLYAIYTSRTCYNTNFSTILYTTRNPVLDDIATRNCLADPALQKVKIKFGRIDDMATTNHNAFGVESQVGTIISHCSSRAPES